ncbi:MAG TPA: ABC transporter ATP-binding protein [Erysipelotrichaceae bacterium]|jgi:ABC-2 type transport system ATP-binding protein|nr:ABC transporter ATP-binding protein [Erysipelotrichaceae bacterium]HQB31709.1 ABC transporter ATP-binding protein [Erysipelotrichaceae bacterium]
MSEYCIELNNLTKKFGKFTAVDDFSLKLLPGKVYGIVGPNGAGKSTTMAMIMGSLHPTSGTGNVKGHELGSREALRVLGYSPEYTSFYDDMNCVEYLWYMGTLSGLSNEEAMEKATSLIKQYDLVDHAYKKVSKFSTGMKKKVSLAQAMIHDPEILLLDEPTANLDPTSRMEILNTVRSMVQDRNLTVLISSHVLTELETVIDHVIMINHGKLIMDESIATAQEKFKQGILVVSCDNNELLYEKLEGRYSIEKAKGSIRITTADVNALKKDVVKTIFENDLVLNVLHEEVLSLDLLYKQALEGEKE